MWTESGVEHMLVYIYDESGAPIGLQYRTSAYGVEEFDSFFFEKNLQGDIVAIYNENGVKIGEYQYDAWGNHSAKHFTTNTLERKIVYNYNPFRYRGYYYDLETGFYYLQTRYYNPEWGRFLNADSALYHSMLGYNMYAYCYNNPVNYYDPTGESAAAWASSMWWLCGVDGPVPVGDLAYLLGILILAGTATKSSAPDTSTISPTLPKTEADDGRPDSLPEDGLPDTLPDDADVQVDMDHIIKYHHPSGGRGPNKGKFPGGLTPYALEELIRRSYNYASERFPNSVTKIQGIRIRLEGIAGGQRIEIWFNTIKNVIETAYPKS